MSAYPPSPFGPAVYWPHEQDNQWSSSTVETLTSPPSHITFRSAEGVFTFIPFRADYIYTLDVNKQELYVSPLAARLDSPRPKPPLQGYPIHEEDIDDVLEQLQNASGNGPTE